MDEDGAHPVALRRGLAGRFGQALTDLGEAEARLVAPAAEPAAARVVDTQQGAAPGRVDDVAGEHRPALVGEVGADEGAVVVVAGDPEALPVGEGAHQRVEAEGLPRLAGGGVVAGIEHDRGAGGLADRARDPVHADVVVAVTDQQCHGLALLGLAEVEVGRGLGGRGVELLALVVGVHRAEHQPLALGRDGTGPDLDVLDLVRQGDPGSGELRERLPAALLLLGLLARLPRLPDQQRQGQQQAQREESLPGAEAAEQLAAAVPAEQQVDRDRQQADPEAAHRGRDRHVDDDCLHLVDLGGGVARDERVALDQLLDRPDLGLAERQRHPDRTHVAQPEVRQQRPGLDHRVAGQRRAYDRVVAHQHGGAAAVEEQRHGDHQPERHAQADQRDTGQQPAGGSHARRACEIE